jgi:hypothetical protein
MTPPTPCQRRTEPRLLTRLRPTTSKQRRRWRECRRLGSHRVEWTAGEAK